MCSDKTQKKFWHVYLYMPNNYVQGYDVEFRRDLINIDYNLCKHMLANTLGRSRFKLGRYCFLYPVQ